MNPTTELNELTELSELRNSNEIIDSNNFSKKEKIRRHKSHGHLQSLSLASSFYGIGKSKTESRECLSKNDAFTFSPIIYPFYNKQNNINNELDDHDIEMGLTGVSLTTSSHDDKRNSHNDIENISGNIEQENINMDQIENVNCSTHLNTLGSDGSTSSDKLSDRLALRAEEDVTYLRRKKIIKEIIHYYTHFLMFIIFEILFYFNYVVEYEKKTVFRMVGDIVDDITKYLNINPSNYNCDNYAQVCTNFVDNHTNSSNTKIYDDALYLIFGMSGFLILLIVVEINIPIPKNTLPRELVEADIPAQKSTLQKSIFPKSTFPKEFGKSLLLMIFVGLFDYLFFNFFILKYKIVDTGELLCYLYEHGKTPCKNYK